jgi:hypothetical protein
MGNCTNEKAWELLWPRLVVLGALWRNDACTQRRSILALIPLASATDAIDVCG